MSSRFNKYMLIFSFYILFIACIFAWVMYEHSLLNEAAQTRDSNMQMYERFNSLKTRWQNSSDIQHKREFLLSHPSLSHQEKRQKTLLLEFKDLSGSSFDKIIATLLNSPFLIKKLTLSRNGDFGTISVELEE